MIATLALLSLSLFSQEPQGTTTDTGVAWQRSLDDALAVSEATGRPLLICVNLDGEPASERFVRTKYFNAAFVRLTTAFVPVIASVDRHSDQDHDEHGHRIHCPRFGTVTCGEHIAMEPVVFERYFDNERVAPRHIGIGLDGRELFDRKLENDIGLVDRSLQQHGVVPAELVVPTDPDELLGSRDSRYRMAVELLYARSDEAGRLELLRKAAASDGHPLGLVRLGLNEESPALHRAAVEALAACPSQIGASLVEMELARADTLEMRRTVLGILEGMADRERFARQLWTAQRALGQPSTLLDEALWREAIQTAGTVEAPFDPLTIDDKLDRLTRLIEDSPRDGNLHLELAEETLAFAEDRIAVGQDPTFLLQDARTAAVNAERNGARAAAAKAVQARANWLLGDTQTAGELAAEALPEMSSRAATFLAANLLEIFAMARTASIYTAIEADGDWPADLISDAHTAFSLLQRHPASSAAPIAAHATLLAYLGARAEAARLLERSLSRFYWDPTLHESLRDRLLTDRGAEALETKYEDLVQNSPDPATTRWFAGYAELMVAESHMRAGDSRVAASYGRAIALFEGSMADRPEFVDSANHYVVLALAGRAQAAFEAGDLERAVADLDAAIPMRPESLESEDGLQRTPMSILRQVHRELRRQGRTELREGLEKNLQRAAPSLRRQLDRR